MSDDNYSIDANFVTVYISRLFRVLEGDEEVITDSEEHPTLTIFRVSIMYWTIYANFTTMLCLQKRSFLWFMVFINGFKESFICLSFISITLGMPSSYK